MPILYGTVVTNNSLYQSLVCIVQNIQRQIIHRIALFKCLFCFVWCSILQNCHNSLGTKCIIRNAIIVYKLQLGESLIATFQWHLNLCLTYLTVGKTMFYIFPLYFVFIVSKTHIYKNFQISSNNSILVLIKRIGVS